MTSQILVRRHTDGRVALGANGCWVVVPGENWFRKDDSRCSGEGWVDLFVAELPEPDNWITSVGDNGEDTRTPTWSTSWGESVTAWIEGIETPLWELQEPLDSIRSDALKMLAAVTACERYQAEQEKNPS